MIAIKNMKMPESCGKCRFLRYTTNILCGDCVEDIADDYYKSWSGGFA